MKPEPEPLDLEELANRVALMMVESFDFPEAEARHRVSLWLAQQHHLEGQVLDGLLPMLPPEESSRQLLRWALEGQDLEARLRRGAAELNIALPPD